MFSTELSSRATRDLEQLGVQVWTSSLVTDVNEDGIAVGDESIHASTVLWAAGVQASPLGKSIGLPTDRAGRVIVQPDLSLEQDSRVFVAGDQVHVQQSGQLLPGVAPVAMQQGRFLAANILRDIQGQERKSFHYVDKGQMATIGRSRAITETGRWKFTGFFAWVIWLVVHIYYLTGFRNRLFVVISWAWSHMTYRRGARLIVEKEWRSNTSDQE